jgi:hypothetical protein
MRVPAPDGIDIHVQGDGAETMVKEERTSFGR